MKRTKERKKERKKCKGCGVKFTAKSGHQIYCTIECRENERRKRYANMYQKRKAQKKVKKAEENKKNKNKGELAILNEKAREMGLSYGQYTVFLQTEKDREEKAKIR